MARNMFLHPLLRTGKFSASHMKWKTTERLKLSDGCVTDFELTTSMSRKVTTMKDFGSVEREPNEL